FDKCDGGIRRRERDFQFGGGGLESHIGGIQRYASTTIEMFLELARLKPVFAEFDRMVSGIEVRSRKCSVCLNGADGTLIEQNGGPRRTALNAQRGQMNLRLQAEDQLGIFTVAYANFLLRRILEAGFRNLDDIVAGLEIGQPQLTSLRGLVLRFTVEGDVGIILTGDY